MTNEIKTRFDSLPWHDAVLLGLKVDRVEPGKRDEVVLSMAWPDGGKQEIRFSDCYALDAKMNFGVDAEESIRSADCIEDSSALAEIRKKWTSIGVDLSTLQCFLVATNSTARLAAFGSLPSRSAFRI